MGGIIIKFEKEMMKKNSNILGMAMLAAMSISSSMQQVTFPVSLSPISDDAQAAALGIPDRTLLTD